MPSTILLLGKAEKNFQYVQKSLHEQSYRFHFIAADKIAQEAEQLPDAELIIIDTLPYDEAEFGQFYALQENPRYAHVPTLALVDENPPRLRYRLVNMGIHDYLTVPFHRLDLEVRCRNLLRLNGRSAADPETLPARTPAIHALQSLQQLYREMNQSIFQLDRNSFIKSVLAQIHQFSKAQITFLFDVREEQFLHLQHFLPAQLLSDEWRLDISDIPLLTKAVRLREPTILNNISADNPFVTQLNAYLNVRIRSFIIYPVVIQNHTRAVLCVLKSDQEKFSELHYLLVENFAHFLVHAHFLSHLRKETENQYDNQVWQFYFEYLDQVVNQLSFGILVISKELRVKYLNENA
ncbi:MAG: GAF domain-containing protein, partial [Calditrichaeota bacterium]|nr:GAF domain-containing protein [Calditrichota bacterium]